MPNPQQMSDVQARKARAYMQAKQQTQVTGKQVKSLQKNIAALQRKQVSLTKIGKPSNQLNFINKDLARKTQELQTMERQHGMSMKKERATGTTKTRYAAKQLGQQQSQQKSSGGIFGGMMGGLFGSGGSSSSKPPSRRPRF